MTTLAHHLVRAEREAPDRAVIHLLRAREADRTITGREFMRGAAAYARAYQAAGVRPGEVVVLILQHGEPIVFAFFGAILHGAIPSIMPFLTEKLSPEKYRDDLKALIDVTRPAAVLTFREFEPEVRAADALGALRVVLLAEDVAAGEAAEPDPHALAGLSRAPEDITLLQHSSGTTGLQKGVALSHGAVLNQIDSYARAIRLAPDDVVVSWLPLYHDMGLIAGFVMPVVCQRPLVLMSPFDWVRAPHRLMQAVTRYRGTLTWLPNFAYNFCAQKIRDRDLDGVDLSSWRAVINCSEPMRWESHRAFAERFAPLGLRPEALATCYAMAENVFAVTQGGIAEPAVVDEVDARAFIAERVARPARPGAELLRHLSCGAPIEGVRLRVLSDDRRDLPERHVGEIALRSHCMLTGYFHRDDLTAQAFHDGWYLTGDLGYLADGQVYVTGRKKDLIIVGGRNIFPGDLEALANDVPGVLPGRAVAFGVFDAQAGTEEAVLVAESELADDGARQQLADAIRARVTQASDVALRRVQVVAPRWVIKTSSGKLARAANRDKFLAETGDRAG